MYCRKCSRLFEGRECPECGKDRWAGEPRGEDPCFLAEKGVPWDGMLADVLKQNGIAFMGRSRMGAAMGMRAPILQSTRFFVRYDDLPRAEALLDGVFGPDAPR